MKSVTLGIIGTGAFAEIHAETLSKHKDVELVSAFDVTEQKANAFTEKWGGTVCASLDALLEHTPDIVTVATPNETHVQYIRDIVQHENAPKLLIVEKPLCISREELEEIQKIAEGSNTLIVAEHSRRFNDGFIRIKDIIASGELGEVRGVKCRYYAGWFHIGSHIVDTLRMWLGDLTVQSAVSIGTDRFEDDPLLNVKLESPTHPDCEISLKGIPEDDYKVFEMDVRLSKGRIRTQWYDIFIDNTQEDDDFAPLLVFSEHYKANTIFEALTELYDLAAAYVREGDTELENRSGLREAAGTMDVLFTASDMTT